MFLISGLPFKFVLNSLLGYLHSFSYYYLRHVSCPITHHAPCPLFHCLPDVPSRADLQASCHFWIWPPTSWMWHSPHSSPFELFLFSVYQVTEWFYLFCRKVCTCYPKKRNWLGYNRPAHIWFDPPPVELAAIEIVLGQLYSFSIGPP